MKFQNLFFAAVAGSAVAAPLAKEQKKRDSVFQCSLDPFSLRSSDFYCEITVLTSNAGFGANESGAEFGENNLPGVWVCGLEQMITMRNEMAVHQLSVIATGYRLYLPGCLGHYHPD